MPTVNIAVDNPVDNIGEKTATHRRCFAVRRRLQGLDTSVQWVNERLRQNTVNREALDTTNCELWMRFTRQRIVFRPIWLDSAAVSHGRVKCGLLVAARMPSGHSVRLALSLLAHHKAGDKAVDNCVHKITLPCG